MVSIAMPAGALAADQTITIQPVTGTAPSHIGNGYRFTPDGLTFSQPVEIRFAFEPALGPANTMVNYGVAFQDQTQAWQWIANRTADTTQRIISVKTTHFTDYGLVWGVVILPATATVKPSRSLQLTVATCYEISRAGATYYMFECESIENRELPPLPGAPAVDPSTWAVNGVVGGSANYGTVRGSAENADYLAPNSAPVRNVVAVSADYRFKGSKAGVVVANVTIEALCGPAALRAAPVAAAADCNGPWIGETSIAIDASYTVKSDLLTWTPVASQSSDQSRSYVPSGVVKFTPADACTQVSPDQVVINQQNTTASLLVLLHSDSITYTGQGGTVWEADVTDTCNGGNTRRLLIGGGWFSGGGTVARTTLIAADKTVAGIRVHYRFVR